jgi:hypothetical protein
MSKIVKLATRFREKATAWGSKDATAAATLWKGLHKQAADEGIVVGATPAEVIASITKFGCFTFPRSCDDSACEAIAADYLRWLALNGTPLKGFPAFLRESALVHPDLRFEIEGRIVSTMFLLHLCIAARVADCVPPGGSVLEIGGGYGGLARLLRLLRKGVSYCIVDLPESLFFSFIFLKTCFPKAKFLLVERTDDFRKIEEEDFDFILVPAHMANGLTGSRFDLVVNTFSLGEMTQPAVDAYMKLLNNRIEATFFYSINRFGQRPGGNPPGSAPRFASEDGCHTALILDAGWEVVLWDGWGEHGFAQIERASAPYLEVLLKRNRKLPRNPRLRKRISHERYRRARSLASRGSRWHYLMWDSIRLWPARSCLREYCDVLTVHAFPEITHYREMLEKTDNDFEKADDSRLVAEGLFDSVVDAPARSALVQRIVELEEACETARRAFEELQARQEAERAAAAQERKSREGLERALRKEQAAREKAQRALEEIEARHEAEVAAVAEEHRRYEELEAALAREKASREAAQKALEAVEAQRRQEIAAAAQERKSREGLERVLSKEQAARETVQLALEGLQVQREKELTQIERLRSETKRSKTGLGKAKGKRKGRG